MRVGDAHAPAGGNDADVTQQIEISDSDIAIVGMSGRFPGAADIAEQAARAAADDVDVAYLRRTGKAQMVNSGEPCRRARLLASKYQEVQGPIGCDSSSLVSAVVDVKIKVKLQLLGAFGFPDMTMSSTASAQPQEGI